MVAPGVVVTTSVGAGSASTAPDNSGQFFVVGQTERGSVTGPVILHGMADYSDQLGNRVSYGFVYDSLSTYFAEGGSIAYVQRVVGTAATAGALTLVDQASGTALPTVRITAANPGAWSSNLQVQILAGGIPNTFRFVLTLSNVIVEDKQNLASPAALVSALSKSFYVTATDLGSTTGAPLNNPAVIAPATVTAGNDQRSSVNTASYTAGLALLDVSLGDGAVAVPGIGAPIHASIIAHVTANARIGLLATDQGTTVTGLVSLAGSYNTDAAGLFAPWVQVSDGAGGIRTIPPEGYVAAKRALAHTASGPWQAPAGGIAASTTLLGLDQTFSLTDASTLDSGNVSPIRYIGGNPRLYGWASLSSDSVDFELLVGRDTLNRLVTVAGAAMQKYVFLPIDAQGQLLSDVNGDLTGIADVMAQAGGLYARYDPNDPTTELDPGFSVDTSAAVNSQASLAANQLKAVLAVRISPTAEFVQVNIVKVGTLAALLS